MEEDMFDDIKSLNQQIEKLNGQRNENICDNSDIDDLHVFFNLEDENKKYHGLLKNTNSLRSRILLELYGQKGMNILFK